MKLPPKKRPGDAVLAADWNVLMDAVAARTPRPGSGLHLIAAPGGFAYSSPPGKGEFRTGPPFAVIAIQSDEEGHRLIMREGRVIERPPIGLDVPVVREWMPEYDGKALDAVPRPAIPVNDGDTVYCKFKTNAAGTITETPEIVVRSTPPDDNTGQGGWYYVELIGFSLDEDDNGVIKTYQQSDIEHWAKLPNLPFLVTLGDTTFNVEAGWVAKRKYSGDGSHLEFIEAAGLVNKPLATCEVWCEVQAGYDDVPVSATIDTGATVPDSIQATPDSPGYYYYRLAKITAGSEPSVEMIHVGGAIFHTPHETGALHPFEVTTDGTSYSVQGGWVAVRKDAGATGSDIGYFQAAGLSNQTPAGAITVIYCEVQTGADDIPTTVQIAAGTELPESIQATDSSPGYYYYHLATVTAAGDPLAVTAIEQVHIGGVIIHERIVETPPLPWQVTITGSTFSVQKGWVVSRIDSYDDTDLLHIEAAGITGQALAGATTVIWCEVQTGTDDVPTAVEISSGSELPETTQATPESGGYYYYHLATITAAGDPLVPSFIETIHIGGHIQHIPNIPAQGMTGYVTLTRHVWENMPHIARLFVRLVNGRQTATLDDYNSGGTGPPAEWGPHLYEINFASTGPVGSSNHSF